MSHRYFIKISFNGTAYNGWQVQSNSPHTVQQKLNEGLSKLLNEKIEVLGCCRTDAGVHAKELFGQFDSSRNDLHSVPLSKRSGGKGAVDWLHKFNSVLPTDISIDGIYAVGPDANTRFDATARTYQYFINSKRNPFLVNRSYYYYSELDIALMNKAARLLMKTNDFSAFSKVNTQVNNNRCKLFKAEWKKTPDGYVFTIRANRFLRGMVRMIVGTMIMIGKHKLSLSELQKIIDSKDCRNAGVSVPACGLYLTKVEYPKKIFAK